MMFRPILVAVALVLSFFTMAQDKWPMVLDADGRTVTIYQPQPESYADGRFSARAAISGKEKDKDPVFGAIWMKGFLEVDRDTRMGTLTQLEVTDIRFPNLTDTARAGQWKRYLSHQIPAHSQPISIDRLIASLESEGPKEVPAFKNEAPKIIYRKEASTLVLLDGEARYQALEKTTYERVVNSPYFMAREKGKSTLFLYGASLWYKADAVEGPWEPTTSAPQELVALMDKDTATTGTERTDASGKPVVPKVVVSTTPAELMQTEGEAKLQPIKGTSLLYVTNSDNDLFMDVASQQYFVLLSGRWYKGPKLDGNSWTYVPADKLPAEFAMIPEDSEKGNVLSSVAGTQASKEAVLDASIPQTAKVDLTSTTTTITYDGDPKWKLLEGTVVYEAENASTTVLYIREHYYACESAVWYDSDNANGPWKVCTKVPAEVQDIPPSSPNYNVKYVQVYETTPTVVYVGYTPGYTGCYVYGPTVVYGTGYYYQPWYGAVYYPRPVTYGFSMHYNPYYGWSMGMSVNYGMLHISVGGYPYHGGYWGPPMYHPPYHGGYHGGNYHGGGNTINIDNSNNFYGGGNRPSNGTGGGGRPGVTPSRPSQQPANGAASKPGQGGSKPSTQPAGRPSGQGGTKPSTQPAGPNNVLTDKQGNVYRDNGKGNYQTQGANGKWQNTPSTGAAGSAGSKPSQPSTKQAGPVMNQGTQQQLNKDMQNRQRGQQNASNYQQQRSAPAQSSYSGGGGGARSGGGGGRGGGGRR